MDLDPVPLDDVVGGLHLVDELGLELLLHDILDVVADLLESSAVELLGFHHPKPIVLLGRLPLFFGDGGLLGGREEGRRGSMGSDGGSDHRRVERRGARDEEQSRDYGRAGEFHFECMKKEIAEPPIVVQCKQHGTPANVMGKDDDDDDDDDDDGRNKNQAQQAQRRKTTHAVARCESSGSISSLVLQDTRVLFISGFFET